MKLISRINTIADKALSQLVTTSAAAAACTPRWENYCVYNPAICTGGHVKYRRYIMGDCFTCCDEHIGCC